MNTRVPIRPAATIALLRDTRAGLEVFLLRRHAKQVFAASNYVYPGGRVDAADHEGRLQKHYTAGARARAEAVLGMRDALDYWVSAARECFEEAGVLVGCEVGKPLCGEALAAARDELNAGTLDWNALVEHMDLRFDPDLLHYFAFWTTPPGQPRRFSTRFFAARMPDRQQAIPDGSETTHGVWMRPADALQRFQAGEIKLMRPTLATLRQLAAYADTADALADMDTREVVSCP